MTSQVFPKGRLLVEVSASNGGLVDYATSSEFEVITVFRPSECEPFDEITLFFFPFGSELYGLPM